MRSRKFIVGIAVLGLVISSCGGSDTVSDASAPADTSASDSGDRERNVDAAAGWGDDGSGVATVSIGTSTDIRSTPRLFLRAEGSGNAKTTAVFATATVRTETKGVFASSFVVNGFQRNPSTGKLEALNGFGNNGNVTIQFTDTSRGSAGVPEAWTILSRKYAALLFSTFDGSDDAEYQGYVEFYDLSTGRVATSLGTKGRVALDGAALGLSWIWDLAYRGIGANGVDQLVVAGGWWSQRDSGSLSIYSFGTDGKPDSRMGGESGVLNLGKTIPDEWLSQNGPAILADPGIEASDAMKVGVVGGIIVDDAESGMSEPGIVSIIVRPGTGSSPVTTVKMNVVSAMELIVQNAMISGDTARVMTRTSWDGEGWQSVEILISSTESWATDMTPASNFVADEDSTQYSQVKWVAAVGNQGDWYGLDVVNEGATWTQAMHICFVRDDCTNSSSKVSRKLVDLPESYSDEVYPTSMQVDASGVQVVVRNSGALGRPARFSLASVDAAGLSSGTPATSLSEIFGRTVKVAGVSVEHSSPVSAGRNAVVATKTVYSLPWTTEFESQTFGKNIISVPIEANPKIWGYMTAWNGTAMFDSSHALLHAFLNDSIGGQVAYVKVDTSTGKIDPAFGIAMVPADTFIQEEECAEGYQGASGPNVFVAEVYYGVSGCGPVANISWFIISTNGKLVTPNGRRISIAPEFVDRERFTGLASDAVGNMYVASTGYKTADVPYATTDENGKEVTETIPTTLRFARIRRYTPSGALDTSFGTNGIVDVDRTTSELLAYVGEIQIAIDGTGKIYLATVPREDSSELRIARLTAQGALDVRIAQTPAATTTTIAKSPQSLFKELFANFAGGPEGGDARSTIDETSTATFTNPASLVAQRISELVGQTTAQPIPNGLSVSWKSAKGIDVVATVLPGGKSCTSSTGKCDIVGLDPTQAYTIVFSKKGDPIPDAQESILPKAKPVVSLKVGKSANTKSLLKLTSKGKPTWKVTGGCVLNAAKSKVTAPKAPTTCQLSVTTAKDGKTPKTTKSVTISVTK